jgi:hypothetical protein
MTASVVHVVNALDGNKYRASIIEIRKRITYVTLSLHDDKELRTSSITTKVAIGASGSFWSAVFPSIMVGYIPKLPPDLDHQSFCDFIKDILFISDMPSLLEMRECALFADLCKERGLLHTIGTRFHRWSRRPIPHIFVVDTGD